MDFSVLVPIHNEEATIAPLYGEIMPVMEALGGEFELILVNDGSLDQSPEKLDQLALSDPRVKVIHFRRNHGQTAALMAAIDHARGEILIPMDGDLQNDARDIPRLIQKLAEGYDVVSGWRKERQDGLIKRRLPSRLANRLISKISGVTLHDYGCTLKAYRRGVLENVRLYGEMHRFIPLYAAWEGAKITEIPVNHRPRRSGHSNYGMDRVLRVILDLILIRFMESAFDRPMQFFGKLGFASLGLSFLAGVWALILKWFGTSFILTPLPLLTVFLALSGVLFVLLGLIAELQMRIYFESQGKRAYAIREMKNLNPEETPPKTG
ncbi:MAG: glycosyltransferase family 2 protein [Magnetococcales bacterium]|nr:glycosyltransferase family 2 protein [Magnetococcales bacterium]